MTTYYGVWLRFGYLDTTPPMWFPVSRLFFTRTEAADWATNLCTGQYEIKEEEYDDD